MSQMDLKELRVQWRRQVRQQSEGLKGEGRRKVLQQLHASLQLRQGRPGKGQSQQVEHSRQGFSCAITRKQKQSFVREF